MEYRACYGKIHIAAVDHCRSRFTGLQGGVSLFISEP